MFDFDPENKEGLLALSSLFEDLFVHKMNDLYVHLREVGVFPVQLALPWMASLFVAFLPVQESQILSIINIKIIGFIYGEIMSFDLSFRVSV